MSSISCWLSSLACEGKKVESRLSTFAHVFFAIKENVLWNPFLMACFIVVSTVGAMLPKFVKLKKTFLQKNKVKKLIKNLLLPWTKKHCNLPLTEKWARKVKELIVLRNFHPEVHFNGKQRNIHKVFNFYIAIFRHLSPALLQRRNSLCNVIVKGKQAALSWNLEDGKTNFIFIAQCSKFFLAQSGNSLKRLVEYLSIRKLFIALSFELIQLGYQNFD